MHAACYRLHTARFSIAESIVHEIKKVGVLFYILSRNQDFFSLTHASDMLIITFFLLRYNIFITALYRTVVTHLVANKGWLVTGALQSSRDHGAATYNSMSFSVRARNTGFQSVCELSPPR